MTAATDRLAKLRAKIAAEFPTAARSPGRALASGIPALDQATGGLPLGAVTEVVCATPSCGSQLLFGQFLAVTRASRARVALVDAGDSFDPDSFPADLMAHLIWVRCPQAVPKAKPTSQGFARQITPTTIALQAADLLARDANLGLVVLDLRRAPEADLRRISGPQWYRFQRAVEPADLPFVVFTPRPSVPSAQLRLVLEKPHFFAAVETERPALITPFAPALQRQRLQASTG